MFDRLRGWWRYHTRRSRYRHQDDPDTKFIEGPTVTELAELHGPDLAPSWGDAIWRRPHRPQLIPAWFYWLMAVATIITGLISGGCPAIWIAGGLAFGPLWAVATLFFIKWVDGQASHGSIRGAIDDALSGYKDRRGSL